MGGWEDEGLRVGGRKDEGLRRRRMLGLEDQSGDVAVPFGKWAVHKGKINDVVEV